VSSTSYFSGSLDATIVHDLHDQSISHLKNPLVHTMITLNPPFFACSDRNSGTMASIGPHMIGCTIGVDKPCPISLKPFRSDIISYFSSSLLSNISGQ
jgi:hypothetical protein